MTTTLFKALQESATKYTWALVARTEFHWQLIREGTAKQQPVLLANIWPTRMKFQRCWPMLHAVRVLQTEGMLDLMEQLFREFNQHDDAAVHAAARPQREDRVDKPRTKQQALPFAGAADIVGRVKRTANVDLVLDGPEMRVLIATHIHVESYRLDACQTLTLLDKAVLLRQQLLNAPLSETENHFARPIDVDHNSGKVENRSAAAPIDVHADSRAEPLAGQVDQPPG